MPPTLNISLSISVSDNSRSGGAVSVADLYASLSGSNPSWLYSTLQLTSDSSTDVVELTRGDAATSDFNPVELTDGTAAAWVQASAGATTGDITKFYHQQTGGTATVIGTIRLFESGGVLNTVNGLPCPVWTSGTVDVATVSLGPTAGCYLYGGQLQGNSSAPATNLNHCTIGVNGSSGQFSVHLTDGGLSMVRIATNVSNHVIDITLAEPTDSDDFMLSGIRSDAADEYDGWFYNPTDGVVSVTGSMNFFSATSYNQWNAWRNNERRFSGDANLLIGGPEGFGSADFDTLRTAVISVLGF